MTNAHLAPAQLPLLVPRGVFESPPVPMVPLPPSVAVATSRDAAEAMQTPSAAIRATVLAHITAQGDVGITCDGVEEALGLRHQTCSPRILELSRLGEVVDTGRRRQTRGHRNAVVWAARQWA